MKRALIMIPILFFPRLLVAQEIDIASLAGEKWYGLYFNGEKAGFAVLRIDIQEDGSVHDLEEMSFCISQAGIRQDLRTRSLRVYSAGGDLLRIEAEVVDSSGTSSWTAQIQDDVLLLESSVGGKTMEDRLPKPKESLKDALQEIQLLADSPEVGNEITFSRFEPMFKQEITGKSRIEAVERRVLDGALTTVFKVHTDEQLPVGTMPSTSFVTEDGTVLEGATAGIITMRLEPKEVARDVNYSNDVIVSNAAKLSAPIPEPRTRESLKLRLHGPMEEAHLFNDDRQSVAREDGAIAFEAHRVSLEGFQPVSIPVTEPSVQEWLKPSTFVQSDDPKLLAKAKEIIGDETDSFKIAQHLCEWVHGYVKTSYSARLSNALEVLENPKGDCTEYSILFIGLARAAGLPAREVAGLLYTDMPSPGFYFHQWAKVWIGKWIDVDPTFNQPLVDVTHIKLAEGDLFQQAMLIPIIGQITAEVAGE